MIAVQSPGVIIARSVEHVEPRRHALRPAGRCCRQEGCGTILSVYNPFSRCSVHQRPETFRHAVYGVVSV